MQRRIRSLHEPSRRKVRTVNTQSTTSTESPATTSDAELAHEATMLRHRAESLRQQAAKLESVLSLTYRRRASELELEAWLFDVQAGVATLEDEGVHSAA
jgi:hypothetical protein